MAGGRERQANTTNTFRIERNCWERWFIGKPIPITILINSILDFYVQNEGNKVRTIFRRVRNRLGIHYRLIQKIEELNNIRKEVPKNMNTIKIPLGIDFLRSVFPDFGILNNAEGPIRVSTCGGVLDKFDFNAELETFVLDTNIPSNTLSDNTLNLIRNALHTFRIYTAFSVRDPQLRNAIRIFQNEYIGHPERDYTGEINWITVLLMNQALREEWQREPFFQGIVPHHSSFQNINPRYVINDSAVLRANRLPQNVIDSADPWGPCFMRALQAVAEEFVNMNLNQSQIQESVRALVGNNNNYAVILNADSRYLVNRHVDVVIDALQRLGYRNIQVIGNSERRLLPHTGALPANIDLTVRHIETSNGQHFQLGSHSGALLWEPYDPAAHINEQSVLNYRLIRFTIAN
jgi:hypothetical protein